MNSGNIIRVGNGEIYIQDEDKQGWHICESSDTPELFECDPEKNVNCTKEGCFINGGPCHKTSHVEFTKKYESIIDALCKVAEVYLIDNDSLRLSVSREQKKRKHKNEICK